MKIFNVDINLIQKKHAKLDENDITNPKTFFLDDSGVENKTKNK